MKGVLGEPFIYIIGIRIQYPKLLVPFKYLLSYIETKVKHAISREKAQELTGYSTEILNMLVKDGLLRYNKIYAPI